MKAYDLILLFVINLKLSGYKSVNQSVNESKFVHINKYIQTAIKIQDKLFIVLKLIY